MHYLVICNPDARSRKEADDFVERLQRDTSIRDCKIEENNTRRGMDFVQLYGITSYPAVIVTRGDNGSVVKLWMGEFPPPRNMSHHFIA